MNKIRSLAVAVVVLAFGFGPAAVSAASAHPTSTAADHRAPRIVARPANLMVNTSTVLSGSGFKPHRRLTIMECSMRTWVVPLKICNHPNVVKVRADGRGEFKVSFKALVCPVSRRIQPDGFRRVCYVGVPAIKGIDTVTLRGAAKLVVTGP